MSEPGSRKVVKSYEACPRQYKQEAGRHNPTREKVTPWTDAMLSSLLRMYGRAEKTPDRRLMKQLEKAVEYLFVRKKRTGQLRKAIDRHAVPEPVPETENPRPSYIWRKKA